MSAIENMVRVVLGALDIDVEQIKEQVTGRVDQFEANVKTLNDTLTLLHERTTRIEMMCETLVKQKEQFNLIYGKLAGIPEGGEQ